VSLPAAAACAESAAGGGSRGGIWAPTEGAEEGLGKERERVEREKERKKYDAWGP
jgi:hypothetical protein